MTFPPSLPEQQGYYRYDPTQLDQQGPARIFPHAGEDGVVHYILSQLRHSLLEQGRLSQPWSLLLHQLETALHSGDQAWSQLTTLLADWEIFQSGWFNRDLPPNEQFNASFVRRRRTMGETLLAARKAAQAVGHSTQLSNNAKKQQQRSQFYSTLEAHQQSRPIASLIYNRDGGLSDREFARQRLAGQNPMVLRRVQARDRPILQPWLRASYPRSNGSLVDLAHAADQHRLFVADYPILQSLTPADLQPGRYVGSPVALFYQGEQGLEPLLIQLEKGRVASPANSDTADDWMRAKLYVQTADATHHELIAHLCKTHLSMEAFAIATPRQLPFNHPLTQLLRPHFQFLLAINTRGNEILLGEGAAIDRLMAPTRETSLAMINRSYRETPFQAGALPKDMHNRGLEPEFLPEFAYRDDAQLLWTAISHYVTAYLQRYYPDDQAIQQDQYLQSWAAELGAPLQSRSPEEFPALPTWLPRDWVTQTGMKLENLPNYARIPDFPSADHPGQLKSLQELIDIATQIIFTCGPQHAAVNFSQFDYLGYVPNAPLALYSRPDTPVSLEQLLPSPEQELGQMELTFALSGILWGKLGSSDLIQFADQGDRQILGKFQTDLQAIEQTIHHRNQQRLVTSGVEYPYLLPSRIPNSINI